MSPPDDDRSGERDRTVDPDGVLVALRSAGAPVLSTAQVGEAVGASEPAVREHLETLEARGLVASHTVAGDTSVWYDSHANRRGRDVASGRRERSWAAQGYRDARAGLKVAVGGAVGIGIFAVLLELLPFAALATGLPASSLTLSGAILLGTGVAVSLVIVGAGWAVAALLFARYLADWAEHGPVGRVYRRLTRRKRGETTG